MGTSLHKTEKELCDFIELNMAEFCRNALGCDLFSFKRESFMRERTFGANKPRVDFEIVTDQGIYLVECKNPTQIFSEVTKGISQLLAYSVLAEPTETKLVLLTSGTLPIIQQTILKFELPIMVVYLNEVLATWDVGFQQQLNAGVIQVEQQYAIS